MRWISTLMAALPLFAAEMPERLQTLLAESPLVERGVIGVQVALAESGEILFEFNANKALVPASNTKLFATALALLRLGPEHRFTTRVRVEQPPDADGRVAGNLVLVGSGDPTLSGREYPYRYRSPAGDPMSAIEWFADRIVAKGVRRIDGDVIGDDTAYVWEPYPDGWSADDPLGESGAPVSALTFGDNTVLLLLNSGDPARISVIPSVEYFQFDNRIVEGRSSRVIVERDLGSRVVRLTGSLAPKGADARRLAVDDPALFAAMALREALVARGVDVRGAPKARHAFRGQPVDPIKGIDLVERVSPPLIETLKVINKASQNLHSELILREVGRARKREGSATAALSELKWLQTGAGIEASETDLRDGSGLSRLNLVTPAAIVKLLTYMYRSDRKDEWVSTMGIAGEDGTIGQRFKKTVAQGRLRAKTGTLSHITALSGYIEPLNPGDPVLAFSIVSNGQTAPSAEVRAFVDKLAVAILE